jgi:hypothetical protein
MDTWLISFESDTIPHSRTEHHLRALHKVVHTVLKSWHEGLFVDEVKIHFLIGGHLDSDVTFDEVDLASRLRQSVEQFPVTGLIVDFEEKDGARGSSHKSLVK